MSTISDSYNSPIQCQIPFSKQAQNQKGKNFKIIKQKDLKDYSDKAKMPASKRNLLIVAALLIVLGVAVIGAAFIATPVLPLVLTSMLAVHVCSIGLCFLGSAFLSGGITLAKFALSLPNITSDDGLINVINSEKIARSSTQKNTEEIAKKIYAKITSLPKLKKSESLTEDSYKEIFDFIEENKNQWYDEIESKKLPFKYLKHSTKKGTLRTIRIDNDGKIYVILKAEIGRGAQKVVRLAIDYEAEKLVGNAVTVINSKTDHVKEINITNKFNRTSRVIQIGNTIRYTGVKHDKAGKPHKASKLSTIQQYYKMGDLSTFVESNNLTPAQKKQLAIDVIKGLKNVHEMNILHRDVKGLNVFIKKTKDEQGNIIYRAFIADFGLACHIQDKKAIETVAGTPFYVAPETWEVVNRQLTINHINFPIDNYSAGLVIAEILGLENFSRNAFAPFLKKVPLNFYYVPAKNEPGYLVWRLIQANSQERASLDEALSLAETIDWNISKKYQ